MKTACNENIERLVEEAAGRVEELTGWDAHLDSLNLEFAKNDEQYWEHSLKTKYQSLGIDTTPRTKEGELNMQSTKNDFCSSSIACYEPLTGTIIFQPIIKDVFAIDQNFFRVILGHELVHRCQFSNNLKFAAYNYALIKLMHGNNAFDKCPVQNKNVEVFYNFQTILREGDPYNICEQLQEQYPCTDLFIDDLNPSKENRAHKKIIQMIQQREGREGVNRLYNLDIDALCMKLIHESWLVKNGKRK